MNRLIFALGLALSFVIPAHAQETTVIVKDPDPPTPAISQTTTTTTDEQHDTTATLTHTSAPRVVHHPVQHHPVHHTAVAYHRPVTAHESTDTQTTTQTTVTVPAHNPSTVVSEHADGSVTVSTSSPTVEVPADQSDDQH
jgi:hypothetical protein